jgi:gamma-glutamylcyclotransferase (GGCT)/AIG2-like uncharacterized protein YtfP
VPAERLAVYGSLAPGQANHHQLAGLAGEWRSGVVRGWLTASGVRPRDIRGSGRIHRGQR